MSRARAALALCALFLLAGCQRSAGDGGPPLLRAALDAYIAGDAVALAAVEKKAKIQGDLAAATPDLATACTLKAASARRALIAAALIKGLDRPRLMAMSETARYVNFVNVASGRGVGGEVVTPPDCGKDHQLVAISDSTALMAMLKMIMTREAAWRQDLQARYGDQWQPRLREAGRLLEQNGIDAGQWSSR